MKQQISDRLKENIKQLLQSKLTSYQLAKKVHVNHTTIVRLRNHPTNIERIHLKLACELSDIYERMHL